MYVGYRLNENTMDGRGRRAAFGEIRHGPGLSYCTILTKKIRSQKIPNPPARVVVIAGARLELFRTTMLST